MLVGVRKAIEILRGGNRAALPIRQRYRRVIVCGGRGYDDLEFFCWYMDCINRKHGPILCVVHGAASGADSLADRWARLRGIDTDPKPAAWGDIDVPGAVVKYNRYGQPYNVVAGYVRNTEMAKRGADHLFAFPGGNGTDHMVSQAKKYNIPYTLVTAR